MLVENIVNERCSFFRPAALYEHKGLLGESDDRQISTSDAFCLHQHVDLSHDLVPPSEVIERPGALRHQPPGISTHAPGLGEIDSLAVDVGTLLRRSGEHGAGEIAVADADGAQVPKFAAQFKAGSDVLNAVGDVSEVVVRDSAVLQQFGPQVRKFQLVDDAKRGFGRNQSLMRLSCHRECPRLAGERRRELFTGRMSFEQLDCFRRELSAFLTIAAQIRQMAKLAQSSSFSNFIPVCAEQRERLP